MFNNKRIQSLQKKSEDALKVFKNSVFSLEEANKQLRVEKSKKLEVKARIDEELDQLDSIEQQNEKFMNKINSIFED